MPWVHVRIQTDSEGEISLKGQHQRQVYLNIVQIMKGFRSLCAQTQSRGRRGDNLWLGKAGVWARETCIYRTPTICQGHTARPCSCSGQPWESGLVMSSVHMNSRVRRGLWSPPKSQKESWQPASRLCLPHLRFSPALPITQFRSLPNQSLPLENEEIFFKTW